MARVNKIVRVGAPVLLGAALVAGAVETGSSGAQQVHANVPSSPYYAEGLTPEYPGALEYPLGGDLRINDVALKVSHFTTDDRPETVRDFYMRELERRNLNPSVSPGAANGYTVSAMLEGGEAQFTVAIFPGKPTQVFPSIMPLGGEVATSPRQFPVELPMSENAVGLTRIEDRAGMPGSFFSYHEPLASQQAVAGNIRDSLGRQGWILEQFTPGKTADVATVIELTRGEHRLQVTVSAMKGGSGASVFAHYGEEAK